MKRFLAYPASIPPIQPTRRAVVTGLAATLGAGLTAPATAASPLEMKRFIAPARGTTWTYKHSDGRTEKLERIEDGAWGSLRIARYRKEIDGGPVEIHGYNRLHGTWVVVFDETEKPLKAADPDDRRYRWPISPRLYWKTKYELRDPETNARRAALADWRVDGFERIAIPDGRAIAVRLVSAGKKHQKVWFSDRLGVRTRVQDFKKGKLVDEKVLTSYNPK